MKTLSFFFHLLQTSIKASMGNRTAFLLETGLMIMNNFIFFMTWWIFFNHFDEIAGWSLNEMIVLMAVGMGSFGLMQICFGGVKLLSKMIIRGDLDSFMTQPKNLLLHIAASRSFSKGWGLLMSSVLLLVLGIMKEVFSLYMLPLMLICCICGGIVFTSFNIISHSLPFWLGSVEEVSKKYCDAFFLFSMYPTNIYSGLLQIVMFTLIPAGLVSYLPVELVRNFSWFYFVLLIASSFFFCGIACLIFHKGLKRYESGNFFSIR